MRITPAHAGKRLFADENGELSRDHPRTCGEKLKKNMPTQIAKGSPPHMRGKGEKIGFENYSLGITPAHAGKSKNFRGESDGYQDHPRTCGEK